MELACTVAPVVGAVVFLSVSVIITIVEDVDGGFVMILIKHPGTSPDSN